MNEFRLACLQMEIQKGEVSANFDKVKKYAGRAADQGVGMLLLPEMWSTSFAYREMPELAAGTPGVLEQVGQLAREKELAMIGSLPEADNGRLYNTAYAVGADGELKGAYRKIHLFPLVREDMMLEPGDKPVTVDLSGLNVGLAICFDLRFPELFRKLALMGARLIVVPAQWPEERLEHWRVLVRARAVENQVYVAAVNGIGHSGMTDLAGHSMIVDPLGEVLAEGGNSEELITAVINPAMVDEVRKEIDYLDRRVRDVDDFLTL